MAQHLDLAARRLEDQVAVHVAALLDGAVLGFIAAGRRRGHSRQLRAEGPWGAPFDADLFGRTFGDEMDAA